jgi:hypothetical protein
MLVVVFGLGWLGSNLANKRPAAEAPGQARYETKVVRIGDSVDMLVRVDRKTGQAWKLADYAKRWWPRIRFRSSSRSTPERAWFNLRLIYWPEDTATLEIP